MLLFLSYIIYIKLDKNLVHITPPTPLVGIWWNITWVFSLLPSCAWKGNLLIHVPFNYCYRCSLSVIGGDGDGDNDDDDDAYVVVGVVSWFCFIFYKVLRVSYCDRPLSVVRHCASSVVRKLFYLNISFETTHWILTKLHRNDPWVVPY